VDNRDAGTLAAAAGGESGARYAIGDAAAASYLGGRG
jgi:hypothetical protein